MKQIVLDTSVAIAWYLPESITLSARKWRDAMVKRRMDLIAPSLHYWEMANVLRTYVRRGELGASLAEEIYHTHLDAPIQVMDPSRERILLTSLEYEASAYDAVYIALAIEQDAALLTAERTTTPWVIKLGKRVEIVREA